MIFCYVILHYKTDKDTAECVRSILSADDRSQIVVVDNASDNGSIERVEELFRGNERVHIIKNEKNLGFASGNNVGYRYAKERLQADIIAVSNNDIIVKTKDLPSRVEEIYKANGFYVMGPDIVSLIDGGHQNPAREGYRSAKEVKKDILRYRILLLISRIGVYDLLKRGRRIRTGSVRKEIPETITENVRLHGSFVVFSPDFVKREDISFREGTFLYAEEDILKAYCDTKGYRMIFVPDIQVEHKEDSSTNALKLSNKEKREFVFSNMIRSLKVYLGYLKGAR